MKNLIVFVLLTLLNTSMIAQEFEVPKNYVLKTNEDYSKYENDILKCIDWLINTPIKTQEDKRKEANTFFLAWLTGCSSVSIEIKTEIVNFTKPNADLLMIFMCGWTKFTLETKDKDNKIMGNQKGIEAVIDFYIKNKEDLKKDKNVEKYIEMKEEGKLEEYISKNA